MRSITVVMALLVFPAQATLWAESTPSPALLVLSKSDRTLTIVDPATLKGLARVPSGPDPHEVIASSDGKLAFISNYGGGAYNTIAVVDLIAQKALLAVNLGPLHGPHGLTFVQRMVYFTAEANKVIGRYDPEAGKVDWVLGTGQDRTHMIWVSRGLDRIYTSNVSSATVSIIERAPGPQRARIADWAETVIPVGKGSEGFDVSHDGKELWVANAQDGTISVIDLAAKSVASTLSANVMGANRLKFTPDGKLAFVSSLSSGELTIFDVALRKESKRLKLGHGAAGILMQPDGSRALVACSPDNVVAVIDLKTLEVTGHIEAGREPDGLAWAVR